MFLKFLKSLMRGPAPVPPPFRPYVADHQLWKVVCTDRYATGMIPDIVVQEHITKGAAQQIANLRQNTIDRVHPTNEELYVARPQTEPDYLP